MHDFNLSQRFARLETKYWELNSRYVRYCLIALVLSLIGHVAYLMFGPALEASPYQLPNRIIEVIDYPDEIRVPPPPKKIERPRLPVDLEPSDTPDDPVDIPATTADFKRWVPPKVEPETIFYPYDTAPEPISIVRPEYPDLARQAYAEGMVVVQVTIDETGRVIEAVVLRTDAIESLQLAALTAARATLFKPALQRDVRVKSTFLLPYSFKLRK